MENIADEKLYPLTLPQQSLYYDYLLFQNDCKYNMGGAILLNGELDLALFRKAYDYTIRQYDVYRQRFMVKDGELFQYFVSDLDINIEYRDFRNHEDPLEDAMQFVTSENRQPFHFEDVCLYREMIIQTADRQFFWFTRFHHFSNDGYGRSIVNKVLSETYNSLLAGGSYPEIKSFPYLDFLEDDLKYRDSDAYRDSTAFWQKKLTPLPEPMDFTSKKYGMKECSLHTERITMNLHRMCYSSMLHIAEDAGVTPFQALLGILFTTLYKLYGKNDMIIGMPVLNRSNHKFRNTPGLFINTIPVRLHLSEDWTFTDTLNAIKSEVKESYRHQRLPLNEVYKSFRSHPEFKNELFDVTIVYRKMEFSQKLGDSKFFAITLDTQTRTESLSLEVDDYDDEENVNLFFDYNPAVLSEQETVQLVRCFEAVLFELIYFPGKKISEVKILSAFEQHKILNTFNSNGEPKHASKTIVGKFEDVVRRWADKPAIVDHERSLTYRELNGKANRLAHFLVEQRHVGVGDVVCLAADRTMDAIVAMLGIIKAGAVYLPLDIHHPQERIRYIVKNSRARLLITDQEPFLDLAEEALRLKDSESVNDSNPGVDIRPGDLAYIIYTSGSTGVPKGVMIEHESFMNMFVNTIDRFGVTEKDRVLQFASLGFDASVFEIFQALLTGAVLVMAGQDVIRDPGSFIRYMDEQRVSLATLPPAYLNALEKPEMPFLHTLITAGESPFLSDVNHYKQFKKYINAYGPTEASVCSSCFIAEKEVTYANYLPVGKAVPGVLLYVLNDRLEPMPIGFSGELCISGPTLARGYVNNEALTEKKFVPNPFVPGMRLYRTGDRARLLADGRVEFLGRLDEQVKIRGNRIEPGEVESRLLSHDLIREAVVLDVEMNGQKDLAAFILSSQAIDSAVLRKFLLDFLPEYMVPQHILFIDQMPLTPNGKIDKASLRRMVTSKNVVVRAESAEPTDLEKILIPIFERILNYSPVRVLDNFFELGGESLKTARLISNIKKELQLEINFKSVFDHPTVRGVASELMTLGRKDQDDPIHPAPMQEYYPLSHAQRRLWILAQDKENAAVYNMPVSLVLEGELDTSAFSRAVDRLVERHEILRTLFTDFDGNPMQKVLAGFTGILKICDLSLEKNAAAKADELINRAVMQPIDLSLEIPFRASLWKINDDRYLLLFLIHHIAGDGLSIGILMNELTQLYNAFSKKDNPFALQPLGIQYKDYCVYERTMLESERYRREKDYWLSVLHSPIPVLNLPTDRMRPAMKTYNGKYFFGEVGKPLTLSLDKFCKEKGVSPFMVLLSVVNVLLYKYTGNEDLIIGSPVAGRNRPELENQVGVYLNTLALRNSIRASQTFLDFLLDVRMHSTEAFSNSDYPFDSLVQLLPLERDTSRAPLFDVLLQYQDRDVTTLNLCHVRSSSYPVDYTSNKFDLIFTFTGNEENISFSIGYNTQLFDTTRIERTSGHLLNLLSCAMNNPHVSIREMDLLDNTEKMMLRKMSEGSLIKTEDTTVVDGFERQVRKTPERLALVYQNIRLTYRQLNQKANAVANKILGMRNIQPDDVIAIMAPRTEQILIGILGIQKAGAAYLPIDPELPEERIRFMLQDSHANLLLTESSLLEKAGHVTEAVLLNIDHLEDPSFESPLLGIPSSSLAYVLYTSGSTGRPKGVMVEHHSLYNLVQGLSKSVYSDVTASLNMALLSPFVFDASVKQVFYALLYGHCLDIVPDETRLNGRKLLEYYENHRIDVSDGTPSHLEILLEELSSTKGAYLPQRFVIGGQQLLKQTVRHFFDLAGENCPVVTNVYGPTECCDVSTSLNMTKALVSETSAPFAAMPVGKPLCNVQVLILGDDLLPVPIGVDGELCIAGEGLARGYLNQPELTESKFLSAGTAAGKRVYRTGDVGRYLEDGTILLSGRTDDQVKLRGFRIELDEIENNLRNYGSIHSAAVVTVGEPNNQELAAYYYATGRVEQDDLRQFLSLHLPVYMVPSYLIEIESLPLTINGKVDKKALPAPLRKTSGKSDDSCTTDPLESKLCKIWKELLKTETIGPEDNFFRLGGHSLIAIRLVSRIHKEFNLEINIWEVFQYPTIASLARLLKSKNPSLFSQIEKVEEKEYYPLSHAQRRLWLLSRLEGQNVLYNLPAALHLSGKLDADVLEKSFQAIVQRHESFRTYFIEKDGEPFQKIAESVDFHIEKAEYGPDFWNKDILNKMAVDYFQRNFDLNKAPLLEMKLWHLSGEDFLLLFNMHHIISDGWSIEIILKEMETYYNAYLRHGAEPFSPLRIQYKDYANWQNKILADESLSGVRDYWHRKLSKPRPLLNLPADFDRSGTFSIEGNLLRYSLSEARTRSLAEISTDHNSSMYMTLLTVVYILLYKYTREEDILVGSPVAGRQHYDLDNQVGFFINTLVLRNEVKPEFTFLEMLEKVNKSLSEAFDNQLYPFDKLVDELDVERIRNRNPLFDVMVAWMVKNGMSMKMNFDGVEAEGLEFSITKSMFDLTFLFEENQDQIVYGIEYNTSLFRQERMERMSEHFVRLIDSIVSNPNEQIGHLEILTKSEKEKLLHDFHGTGQILMPEENVVRLFTDKALSLPDTVALVCERQQKTYKELDEMSDRVASLLKTKAKIEKENIVAVMVEDPVLSVVALLGVMKTGAAYLPILTENPLERITYILQDSQARVLLVDGEIKEPENCLLLDLRIGLTDDSAFVPVNPEPESLAYVIYTSGSTGKPKGVMVEHRSLTNLIASVTQQVYSRYPECQRELMISSFAFDVSLKQIFATLCNGNTLHILNKEKRLDAREIIRYMIDEHIHVADITPSLFSVMLEEGFGLMPKPDLRELFLGSEALPFKLIKHFYANPQNRSIKLTNFYGPTECCVESSSYRFDPEHLDDNMDIAPIGKPILHEQMYVLDPCLNVCPIGIPGEICISGAGLARQYLNDPENTSNKFVQFELMGNARIYKTGDLGRVLADGNIEYLGRLDEQVKIRGYRVELQEVEKHLRELQDIGECAVTLYGNELAAYFTSEEMLDAGKLRSQLERSLPKYMVPAYFHQMEKMPVSSNGKVDKKQLPDPMALKKKKNICAPRDEVEKSILRACTNVLKREGIGMDDNFFEIGGNSLNAVRLISQIQKELDVDLALKDIFYNPVLLDIADTVRKSLSSKMPYEAAVDAEKEIVPISDEELKLLSELQFDDDEY